MYNAHHSPIGVYASFTIGYEGKSGGLGLELGGPANQNIYIGIESTRGEGFDVLPFCEKGIDESADYDVEHMDEDQQFKEVLKKIEVSKIQRAYTLTTDSFKTDDLDFTIISPCHELPDPSVASEEAMKKAIMPAIYATLTIDNSHCDRERTAFFGFEGNDLYSHLGHMFEEDKDLVGIVEGRRLAITTKDQGVVSAIGFNADIILNASERRNWETGLGDTGLLIMTLPAGEIKTFSFAISFYSGGLVTSGMDMSYYYTKFFDSINDVAKFALDEIETTLPVWEENQHQFDMSKLSEERRWMMIHAIRSYYGSTQLMSYKDQPFWIVNEGEYRMMNTLDLTVDHLFYELKMNPWVVKNTLESFVNHYAYEDQCGISFTHDMGVANTFSKSGYSSYEKFGLSGCFSQMTYEELLNFSLCALTYSIQIKDEAFYEGFRPTLEACLESLLNRDNEVQASRIGLMTVDSERCMGGSEITTYDSLDVSLGQSRRNLYIGGKSLSAFYLFACVFEQYDNKTMMTRAMDQAKLCAQIISASADEQGLLPAVIEEGGNSSIIPVVEGLAYIGHTNLMHDFLKETVFREYQEVLETHIKNVLVKGVCLFEDGGYRLSSTSKNSWLSKIYLNQYVIEDVMKMSLDEGLIDAADQCHMAWLLDDKNSYYSWSDQMVAGIAKGSKYYPRGVTSILWL